MGIGYIVADNLAVSLSGAYTNLNNKFEAVNFAPAATETITTTLAVMPQLTYYFAVAGKLKPLITAGIGYVWYKQRDSRYTVNNNVVYQLAGPTFGAAAGLSYFITSSVGFDLGLQYAHNNLNDKNNSRLKQEQNILGANIGVSVFFIKQK